jgi:hypothetical protein
MAQYHERGFTMLSHALTIIVNELNHHLTQTYGISANHAPAGIRNLAFDQFPSQPCAESASQECLNLTLVNLQEGSAYKNNDLPTRDATGAITSPPCYANAQILLSATHTSYSQALLMLDRAMQFFHAKPVLTNSNVTGDALTQYAPELEQDRLHDFQLVISLRSTTLEENQQIWSAFDHPQVPFALYDLRQIQSSTSQSSPTAVLERRITPNSRDKD